MIAIYFLFFILGMLFYGIARGVLFSKNEAVNSIRKKHGTLLRYVGLGLMAITLYETYNMISK